SQNAVEDRADQQRRHRLRRAHQSHEDDGQQQQAAVRPRIAQQPPELAHARTLNTSAAAITSSTAIRPMASGFVRTCPSVRQGAQFTGSLGPNSTTTGTPKAAAMCAGPLSLPM